MITKTHKINKTNRAHKNRIGSLRCKCCDKILKDYEDKYCSECNTTEIIEFKETKEILDDIA